jgi:hypothetical protein
MNGVDQADQLRSYYRNDRHLYRTWRPLFNYLFHTTICNASKLWIGEGHGETKTSGHLAFRLKLASQLMKHTSAAKYTLPIDGIGVRTKLASHV